MANRHTILRSGYKTIANFCKEHPEVLKKLFREFVILCRSIVLIDGAVIAIDGACQRPQVQNVSTAGNMKHSLPNTK
jgi:transposase